MSRGKSHFFSFGLPFLTFMVLGHQGLTYIGQGRYDIRDETARQQELMHTQNRVVIPAESLQPPPADDYEIKRISRPADTNLEEKP